jgi:hypothetical protein
MNAAYVYNLDSNFHSISQDVDAATYIPNDLKGSLVLKCLRSKNANMLNVFLHAQVNRT